MALTQNRHVARVWRWLRSEVGVRFIRFMGVAALALATSLVTVAVCDGVLHLTSVPTALISQVTGAIVSYVLSRRAWERKGRPDVMRETIPFWIAFGVATVISTGFTKLGYTSARWMHVPAHSGKDVLVVEGIYFIGNVITFLMRFAFFHYVVFADRKTAGDATTAAGPRPESLVPEAESLVPETVDAAAEQEHASLG
jgi:putative flippase GtrA